ncbi:thioredoxin family protein [uncultured Spirosoma sp.]|uniref:thioredoxin family protein n=1 Tax=uncultured Spirosoma sp. TaxID=278208 RepID=UPI00258911C1|nr:thioredoxin family protein [uncultured Spirosoma sp.]
MKKLLALLLLTHLAMGQKTATKSGGIQFKSGPVAGIFQEARRTGKPVFIEIFSPTCHVCQSFVPTLADSRVGRFYNDKFVSTKLDIALPSTQQFLNSQKLFVPSLPLFLFFDPQQNMIHFAMSNNSVDEVIRQGTIALNPQMRSQNMKARYQQGERGANFLIDYAMQCRVTKDTASGIAAMNDYAKTQSPANYASQTNYLALQKLVLDFENPMAQYMFANLGKYKQYDNENFTAHQVAENILMSSLYSGRGAQYPISKILQIRQDLVKIGIEPKVAANRTLLPEVNAYFRARQTAKAVERMDNQTTSNQLSVPEYIYIAHLFNRSSPDPSDVPTVVKWTSKGLAMKPPAKEQSDLYYEQAEAYRRAGKVAEARTAAQKSMEQARAGGISTARNTEQLSRLK